MDPTKVYIVLSFSTYFSAYNFKNFYFLVKHNNRILKKAWIIPNLPLFLQHAKKMIQFEVLNNSIHDPSMLGG
jgi:hypothetical protein